MLYRASIGGQDLAVECDARLRGSAEALLDRLRTLSDEGIALQAGSRIQYGWSVLTLQAEGGLLRLCEPDFDGDALHHIRPTLDTSLDIFEQQTQVLHRSSLTGMQILFSDDLFVRNRALEAPHQFLKRQVPAGGQDSGWYIGNLDRIEAGEPDDDSEIIQVFELLRRRPALLQVLMLPPRTLVVFRADAISEILDEDGNSHWR